MSDKKTGRSEGEEQKGAKHKGHELIAKAEKTLTAWSFFGMGKQQKHEDASELFEKAAAQFKIKKDWSGAASCYLKAAENAELAKDSHRATSQYVNAAKAYQNAENFVESVKYFKIACSLHMDSNSFSQAANLWKTVAQVEEKNLNTKGSMAAWQEAADCYKAANQKSQENSCLIHVADISAEEGDYTKAIDIYEEVAKIAADSSSGRWSVKDHLYKASLCQFVLKASMEDVKSLPALLENYKASFPTWDDCRQAKFIDNLVEAFEEENAEKFADVAFKHDEIYKLDPWKSRLLAKIRKILDEGSAQDDEVAKAQVEDILE